MRERICILPFFYSAFVTEEWWVLYGLQLFVDDCASVHTLRSWQKPMQSPREAIGQRLCAKRLWFGEVCPCFHCYTALSCPELQASTFDSIGLYCIVASRCTRSLMLTSTWSMCSSRLRDVSSLTNEMAVNYKEWTTRSSFCPLNIYPVSAAAIIF